MLVASQESSEQVLLRLDVLLFAVSIFSGYIAFANNGSGDVLKDTFPFGLAVLFGGENWKQHIAQVSQISVFELTTQNYLMICFFKVLEWLYYVVNLEYLPKEYRVIFRECLVCLRNETEFRTSLKWMKYVETEFVF